MGDLSEVFVALDVAKGKNAVAIAEGGRRGEVRYLGEIENSRDATRKLVAKLCKTYQRLTFCYEAGPTGYGLYRWIKDLGHDCIVVAPSLIPSKPGDRVKTNRRDAESMAKLLRAGELTAVWVPDEKHEAMRDLVRAREGAAQDLTRKRQQVTAFLLRQGRTYPQKKDVGRNARPMADRAGLPTRASADCLRRTRHGCATSERACVSTRRGDRRVRAALVHGATRRGFAGYARHRSRRGGGPACRTR